MKKRKDIKGIVFFFLLYFLLIGVMVSYDRSEEGRRMALNLQKGYKLYEDFVYSIKWELGYDKIEKKIAIHEYVGKEEEVVVPEEIEGLNVEIIQGKQNLENGGFVGKVKKVILPRRLKEIGDYAFAGSEVEEIDIYSKCKIGNYAFANCSNLKEVKYWDSKRNTLEYSSWLGEGVFLNCISLRQMDLLRGSGPVPDRCFEGCENLWAIELKGYFQTIGKGAFRGCRSLRGIWLTSYIYRIEEGAFEGCTELPAVFLPERLEYLEKDVFKDCISLTRVQIPKNFEVDMDAFTGCTSLKSIKYYKSKSENPF